ncbi:MAG: dienelactone hydrolase family protein [Actinomycetota bacterium]|nr:dienelactone hydrolase family protein [Actinomycetota bacterium]
MPDVTFPSNGSTAPGYLAIPQDGHGLPVVVLQEFWGLEDHIRSVCDRLASNGFLALAPDLYRGDTTTEPDEAQQKMMALDMDQAERDMRGAVDFLADHEAAEGGRVAALGFCLGGGLSVWAAAANPKVAATVTYYYVMPHGTPDFSAIQGPVLGHFGTADEFVPVGAARDLERSMRDAGVEVEFEFYEGAGHAFFNDTNRLGTYDEAAALRSWHRTGDFLRDQL